MVSKIETATPARSSAWKRLARMRRSKDPLHLEPAGGDEVPADRREAAQAERLVKGVLRHVSLLDALLMRGEFFEMKRTPKDLLWVLRLAAYEKVFQSGTPDYAIGEQAVALARAVSGEKGARFVNAMMRRLMPSLPADAAALDGDERVKNLPPETRWSVPGEIIEVLTQGYGEKVFRSILPALAEREAPVWLRVNLLKTTPEAAAQALAEEGVEVEPGPGMAEALLWRGGESAPWKTEAWRRGELTVQDLGAMLAARLLAPEPGMTVLDGCAAPGGKAGHLWEIMQGRGRLVAMEIDPARRKELARAMERLHGGGIEIAEKGLTDEAGEAMFDRVLLDVPCLALGLIGRHPEIRWDGRLRFLAAMTAKQRELLAAGAARTKPGGRLLWVTCSPTPAENEKIILAWLNENRAWKLADPNPLLNHDLLKWISLRDGFARTRPDLAQCDGFTMALLERCL